jgi:hypothetical protein
MKKIILISFFSFFFSSSSYSESKNIATYSINTNRVVSLKCEEKNKKFIKFIQIINKNNNPGVVYWAFKEEDESLLSSYQFVNKLDKSFVFYENLGGDNITKTSYQSDSFLEAIKNNNKFSMDLIMIKIIEAKKSKKLYDDYKKIAPNWRLEKIVSNHLYSRDDLKKIEEYSNSLKDIFESKYEEAKKLNVEKTLTEKYELFCDTPKAYKFKN